MKTAKLEFAANGWKLEIDGEVVSSNDTPLDLVSVERRYFNKHARRLGKVGDKFINPKWIDDKRAPRYLPDDEPVVEKFASGRDHLENLIYAALQQISRENRLEEKRHVEVGIALR